MTAPPPPLSLLEALSCVPDPRSRCGLRHPLSAVLALAERGAMCGCRSVYAVLQWAAVGAGTRAGTRAGAWRRSWGWAATASPPTG